MRVLGLPTITMGVAAVWLLGGLVQPAEAGKLCKNADLSSPCVSSTDLKPNLKVCDDDNDGRLRVESGDRTAVELRGSTANVTNLFSNDEDESNGLVKAWAKINADGSIAACWRCNTDASETLRTGTGLYSVDFTPLAPDITGRPRSATVSGVSATPLATIRMADTAGDASSVNVATNNPTTGAFANAPFVVLIY
jgi:hypothetical protein